VNVRAQRFDEDSALRRLDSMRRRELTGENPVLRCEYGGSNRQTELFENITFKQWLTGKFQSR
jgi:hypothetical protein